MQELSDRVAFADVCWADVPDAPGVYVIYDVDDVIYVGMAGRNGAGSLRRRLKDHASGQIVNMFAQYLFLDRVQFVPKEPIRHPRDAKAACRAYIVERCSFRWLTAEDAAAARDLESRFKSELQPAFNK